MDPVAEPGDDRPAGDPEDAAERQRGRHGRPPGQPQGQGDGPVQHRRGQGQGEQGQDQRQPAVLVDRVPAQQRDHRHPDQQAGADQHEHEHHEGRPRGPRRHPVVAAQPHLGDRRPDRARHVLAQLAEVEDAHGPGVGQAAPEVGQRGPPGAEGGVDPGQHQGPGGQHDRDREPAQQRPGLAPLAGQDDDDDSRRTPRPRPAAAASASAPRGRDGTPSVAGWSARRSARVTARHASAPGRAWLGSLGLAEGDDVGQPVEGGQ